MLALIVTLVSCVIAIILTIVILYAFVQDWKTILYIFIHSFKQSFSKEEQNRVLSQTTDFLNQYFQKSVSLVTSTSNKDLQAELSLSTSEVKRFKQEMVNISKDHSSQFISLEAVKKVSKENKDFNFINQIINNTALFSNDKAILMRDLEDKKSNGLVNDDEYMKELLDLKNLSPKQAHAKMLTLRLQGSEFDRNILPFANEIVGKHVSQIKKIYNISKEAELV